VIDAIDEHRPSFLDVKGDDHGFIFFIQVKVPSDRHIHKAFALIKGGQTLYILLQDQLTVLSGFTQQPSFPAWWTYGDQVL